MQLPPKLDDAIIYRFIGNLKLRMVEENQRVKKKIEARGKKGDVT